MDSQPYVLTDPSEITTPALLYYRDYIEENTRLAIKMAGGPDRLWPHVKSHKMARMIAMQRAMGITRFKCATIAEAEMVAGQGGGHILLAYPLVGPSIRRFLALEEAFPGAAFYAIGDDFVQLSALSGAAEAAGRRVRTLLDVNMGMNRTGAALDRAAELYRRLAALPGLSMEGLHGYDGHSNQPDFALRKRMAAQSVEAVHGLRRALEAEGVSCGLLVMGGTPSFPIHLEYPDAYLSPGTIFLLDARYAMDLTELPMRPAAALLTRVVSHPGDGLFTLDLGSKGISTDAAGRGMLLGWPEAKPLFQSEEHWVYQAPPGGARPAIGEVLYVLPMHVCTANALYPFAHVVQGGRVVDRWEITARDRALTL